MKKGILIGMLALISCGMGWCMGEPEQPKASNDIITQVDNRFGFININVTVNKKNYDGYTILKNSLLNENGTVKTYISDIVTKQSSITSEAELPDWFKAIEFVKYNDPVTDAKHFHGSLSQDDYNTIKSHAGIDEKGNFYADFDNASSNISFLQFARNQLNLLIIFQKGGQYTYQYASGVIQMSSFYGEAAFFADSLPGTAINTFLGASNLPYEDVFLVQAMAFMRECLFPKALDATTDSAERSLFNTIVDTYVLKTKYPNIKFSTLATDSLHRKLYPSSPGAPEAPDSIIDSFKNMLSTNFIYKNENVTGVAGSKSASLYYLDLSATTFKSIYDKWDIDKILRGDTRNPYIMAYLLFLFLEKDGNTAVKSGKPALSYMINEKLKAVENNPVPYNFSQYKEFNQATLDGDNLAKAALKYMTWGVEYTPFNINNVSLQSTNRRVLQNNETKIQQWLTKGNPANPNEEKTRMNNYFPLTKGTEAGAVTYNSGGNIPGNANGNMHYINDNTNEKTAMFASRLIGGQKYELSKIDIWTGNNLAWIDGRIKSINLNGSLESPASHIFNDKSRNTTKIVTANVSKTIEVGYKFNSAEKIGGFLVIGKFRGTMGNTVGMVFNSANPINVTNLKTPLDVGISTQNKFVAFQEDSAGAIIKQMANLSNGINTINRTNVALDLKSPANLNVTGSWDSSDQFKIDNAFDGKPDTGWTSGNSQIKPKETIYIDLDKTKQNPNFSVNVDEIEIVFRKAQNVIVTVKVSSTYLSDTANNWPAPIYTSASALNWDYTNPKPLQITIPINRSVHCISIDVTSAAIPEINSYAGCQINEIRVFEKSNIPDSRPFNDSISQYRYFVLPEPINNINDAKLIFTGVDEAIIEELLVFDENPLAHVTGVCKPEVGFTDLYSGGDTAAIPRAMVFNNDINKYFCEGATGLGAIKGIAVATKQLSLKSEAKGSSTEIRQIKTEEILEVYGEGVSGEGISTVSGTLLTGTWFKVRAFSDQKEGWVCQKENNGSTEVFTHFTINDKKMLISLPFAQQLPLRMAVLWDKKGSANVYDGDLMFIGYGFSFLAEVFARSGVTAEQINTAVGNLTSPFFDEKNNVTPGNPLPYAPMGLDTPRTFAYKMYEQKRAREWYAIKYPAAKDRITSQNTTLAVDDKNLERYNEGYVDEMETFMANGAGKLTIDSASYSYIGSYPPTIPKYTDNTFVKPFLPGFYLSGGGKGYVNAENSPYQPDKSAGVDSLGLLSGALGMTSLPVYDVWNGNIRDRADAYSSFSGTGRGGDATGFPIFYTGKMNTIVNGDYRMTRADLEKSTVIVPDISLIQKGDLLVRYDTRETGAEEDIHMGIVVGLGWTNGTPPAFGDDPGKWMEQVYVVSVRRGFQCVTIGTWGNQAGSFGGFTDNPKSYQIRRLLKLTGTTNVTYQDVSWECVKRVDTISYKEYPTFREVPIDFSEYVQIDLKYSTERDNIIDQAKVISEGNQLCGHVKGESFFFKILPPTHLEMKANLLPIKDINNKLPVSSLTGWRILGIGGDGRIDFHRGVDISNDGNNTHKFVAPENGNFWIIKPSDKGDFINLSGNITNKIIDRMTWINQYSGCVGVLDTTPLKGENGRVYVFCHMDEVNQGSIQSDLYTKYVLKPGTYYPNGPDNSISVKEGDEIGFVGHSGATNGVYHVHLEVYEYFEMNSAGTGGWERVDPLSCFNEDKLKYMDVRNDNIQIFGGRMLYLNSEYSKDQYYMLNNICQKDKVFKLWAKFVRKEDAILIP